MGKMLPKFSWYAHNFILPKANHTCRLFLATQKVVPKDQKHMRKWFFINYCRCPFALWNANVCKYGYFIRLFYWQWLFLLIIWINRYRIGCPIVVWLLWYTKQRFRVPIAISKIKILKSYLRHVTFLYPIFPQHELHVKRNIAWLSHIVQV